MTGITSNATEQMVYGDFREIADTANFIIVHPQGTKLNNEPHFNVGGWTVGSQVDDVGFTAAMIDEISTNYQIDANRIYSTGMSNGGYMSFLLACQLSDRIAAIASVTGSMTPETFSDCSPTHPTPILQIHGTQDGVVPYNGAAWTKSIQEVLDYWIAFNNCSTNPSESERANSNTADGSTVSHIVYGDGDRQVNTEHLKVTGGGHTWSGTRIPFPGTNYDINASLEVWNFLSRYNLENLRDATTNTNDINPPSIVSLYPNPVSSNLTIDRAETRLATYQLFSSLGHKIKEGTIAGKANQVNMSDLSNGLYFLQVGQQSFKVLKKH